jgi:hypothetical protein
MKNNTHTHTQFAFIAAQSKRRLSHANITDWVHDKTVEMQANLPFSLSEKIMSTSSHSALYDRFPAECTGSLCGSRKYMSIP